MTIRMIFNYFLAIAFVISGYTVNSQVEQVRKLDSTLFASQLDSLRETCSYRKTFLPDFETEIISALSYFPELDSTHIVFKEAKIRTSLNARPTIGSLLFRRRANRKYVVRIKPNNGDSVATLDQVGFNGAVGVLGHELNHIVDYSNRGFFRIIGRLFNYTNKKGKQRYEGEIDRMTVAKGLGWQLYDWGDYVFNKSNAKAKYLDYKKAVYLTPNDLIIIIKEFEEQN